MKVCFLLPDLTLSGGVGVVVQHARRLAANHGFEVGLVTVRRSSGEAWGYRGLDEVEVLRLDEAVGTRWDVAVATWWETAYVLARLRADRHAYFVQSLEDRFYGLGDPERALAALTRALPVSFITEAQWIADFLQTQRADAPVFLVRNGVDKEVFSPPERLPERADGPLRVLIEGHPRIWYKGVPEALAAVRRMEESRHLTVVSPSTSEIVEELAWVDRIVGPLSAPEMALAMADSDVLLKLSRVEGMAGPPLEAFHMGATCVTTAVTGHEEYVRHGDNALVVGWDDPHGTARALDLLARDRPYLNALRERALMTAKGWHGWDEAAAEMAEALSAIHASPSQGAAVTGVFLSEARAQVAALALSKLRARVADESTRRQLRSALDRTASDLERWQARALDVHARLHDLQSAHAALEREHQALKATRAYRLAVRLRLIAEHPVLMPMTRAVRWILSR